MVGHGHHHDEYGRAAFFGAREFFFGIAEHEFVGYAPCVGFCFGIVGFEGVFIDDFVDAQVPQEGVEIAPAAVARRNIDDAVAGIEIGFEHVAGKNGYFAEKIMERVDFKSF